jgi:hypothetical protein
LRIMTNACPPKYICVPCRIVSVMIYVGGTETYVEYERLKDVEHDAKVRPPKPEGRTSEHSISKMMLGSRRAVQIRSDRGE